jgi:asparagine synthase (glutamine-hydrolysing)
MNDVLVHRGPDADGTKVLMGRTASVALGHRRLSIVDLAGGSQPMSNEDGTVWITYNGEIYNHAELRPELEARGHYYKTRSDTETIVHAYEEWGTDCVKRFRGMFAFVIWDSKKEILFAARDRMGIKPLYYSSSNGKLLFGSEIKALFASRWCTPQLNLKAVPEHLTLGYLAGNATLFRGVNKLLPGNWLTWKDGELKTEQYWEIPLPDPAARAADEADLVDQFLQLFRESVQSHLMSDVPLGVFLSGGLDSSAIAATMADQMSDPVKTFSVGFESEYYSEFDFAREVASSIGADHHEVVLKPDHMLEALPGLIWHEDEPIRNASSVALAEVARLASSQVKVVLTGEGSDELFAGYERYWATLFNMSWGAVYHRVAPRWVRDTCIRQTMWRWPLPLSTKKKISHSFINYSLRPEEIVFENWHSTFPPRSHCQLLSHDVWHALKDVDPYAGTMQLYERRPDGDLLDRLLYTDQKAYLVELLRKQDTMSMAASIESRVPFLDHKMVEFAAHVPAKSKIRRFNGKHLVKRAMRQILPAAIVNRKKMGFPVPIGQWFRGNSARSIRSVLTSKQTREHGVFNSEHLVRLLDEHVQGVRDNSDELWMVLNFELWTRIFIDGHSCASVSDELVGTDAVARRACLAGVA